MSFLDEAANYAKSNSETTPAAPAVNNQSFLSTAAAYAKAPSSTPVPVAPPPASAFSFNHPLGTAQPGAELPFSSYFKNVGTDFMSSLSKVPNDVSEGVHNISNGASILKTNPTAPGAPLTAAQRSGTGLVLKGILKTIGRTGADLGAAALSPLTPIFQPIANAIDYLGTVGGNTLSHSQIINKILQPAADTLNNFNNNPQAQKFVAQHPNLVPDVSRTLNILMTFLGGEKGAPEALDALSRSKAIEAGGGTPPGTTVPISYEGNKIGETILNNTPPIETDAERQSNLAPYKKIISTLPNKMVPSEAAQNTLAGTLGDLLFNPKSWKTGNTDRIDVTQGLNNGNNALSMLDNAKKSINDLSPNSNDWTELLEEANRVTEKESPSDVSASQKKARITSHNLELAQYVGSKLGVDPYLVLQSPQEFPLQLNANDNQELKTSLNGRATNVFNENPTISDAAHGAADLQTAAANLIRKGSVNKEMWDIINNHESDILKAMSVMKYLGDNGSIKALKSSVQGAANIVGHAAGAGIGILTGHPYLGYGVGGMAARTIGNSLFDQFGAGGLSKVGSAADYLRNSGITPEWMRSLQKARETINNTTKPSVSAKLNASALRNAIKAKIKF